MSSELHNKIVYAMKNRIRWLDQHGKEWIGALERLKDDE